MGTPATQSDGGGDPSHAISLYVNNKPGVLNRIGLVFSRRGWNIDSLSVSPGHETQYSRMSIVAKGDSAQLSKIVAQLSKLVDVLHAEEHPAEELIARDLALIKISCGRPSHDQAKALADPLGARVIGDTDTTITFELVDAPEAIDEAHNVLSEQYRVLEMVRSGAVVIAIGEIET